MSSKKAVLDKIARNLQMLGEDVRRGAANEVIVENGSADVTISYADASFSPSMMGGVDGSASPFLGIGIANPGKITMSVQGVDALATVLVTAKAIRSFAVCAAFANSIQLLDATTGLVVLQEIRGHVDMVGVGQ